MTFSFIQKLKAFDFIYFVAEKIHKINDVSLKSKGKNIYRCKVRKRYSGKLFFSIVIYC